MANSQTISRRTLSHYGAKQILAGKVNQVLEELAAYLTENNQTKDYELLLSDIERELARNGLALARVQSARPLSKKSQARIIKFLKDKTKADKIELVNQIEPTLIGGAIISCAGYTLDASIKNRINKLKKVDKE